MLPQTLFVMGELLTHPLPVGVDGHCLGDAGTMPSFHQVATQDAAHQCTQNAMR